MALIYPLGIPSLYAYQLWRARGDLDPGIGQKALLNKEVVRYKVMVDSDKSKDGYIVGDQDTLSEGLTRLEAELVKLDEEGAMRCALFLREELEEENR